MFYIYIYKNYSSCPLMKLDVVLLETLGTVLFGTELGTEFSLWKGTEL